MTESTAEIPTEVVLRRFLSDLNENQNKAVTANPHGRLQIIAGPGTGKTKVLTSRVAYLLIREKIPPEHIIVTTFTKKAANEMIERLEKMLVDTPINVNKLLIGTFHSICYRIIKRYGKKLGISDYRIADERDKNHFIKQVLEKLTPEDLKYIEGLNSYHVSVLQQGGGKSSKQNFFSSQTIGKQISSLKSKGYFPQTYAKFGNRNKCLEFFYDRYQSKLAENQALDFDDCLLYCYKLISEYPVLNYIRHVLVDEFQDTNELQLHLMFQFANGHPTNPEFQHNLTIVGDPDQSIYGFRDAQSINFQKMIDYYEKKSQKCTIVSLNENYRSTRDILEFSERVMRQQVDRVAKSLNSQLTNSFKPVYGAAKGSDQEARWIVYQIKHLLELPNCPVEYKDISILVRAAYQTRAIEEELVKFRLPYHMIRGKAFWEREEVIGIMDYLRIVGDEYDRVSVLRTLNYPKRGLGPKSMTQIEEFLNQFTGSTHEALAELARGKAKNVKVGPKLRKSLEDYVKLINDAKSICSEIDNMEDQDNRIQLAIQLFDLIYEKSTLKNALASEESKHENVMEVKKLFEGFVPTQEALPVYIGGNEDDVSSENRNYILQFIESVGLFETNAEDPEDGEGKGKISLSTIHGSKGLEWPVVFVPGLSERLLPSGFAMSNEDLIDEERRCFYVATTRARSLLYISSYTDPANSKKWGEPISYVSRFIEGLINDKRFDKSQDAFSSWPKLTKLYKILGKQPPANTTDFPLDQFNQLYKSNVRTFMRGKEVINLKEYLQPPAPPGEKKKANNAKRSGQFNYEDDGVPTIPPSGSGFVTGAEIRDAIKRRAKEDLETHHQGKKPNKAPIYIPNRNVKAGVVKGKKAPAYVPGGKSVKVGGTRQDDPIDRSDD